VTNLGVLPLVYCQLHLLELLCKGVGRNQATHAAYRLYARHLIALAPHGAWELFRGDLTARYGCLGLSAAATADRLRGSTALAPEDLGRVRWLLEACRRVALGGDPVGVAARGAHDAHLGRPRRRRRPVEVAWVAEQVDAAQDAVWSAILERPPGIVIPPKWEAWLADHPERPIAKT
jgi:hypothetical protein